MSDAGSSGVAFYRKAKRGTQDAFKSLITRLPPIKPRRGIHQATFRSYSEPIENDEQIESWNSSCLYDGSSSSHNKEPIPPVPTTGPSSDVTTTSPVSSPVKSILTHHGADKTESSDAVVSVSGFSTSTDTLTTTVTKQKPTQAPTVRFSDSPIIDSLTVVFLQYKGSTKRVTLSSDIKSLDGIRALFVRSFLTCSSFDVTAPGTKIYIQDPEKPDVFYELEDFGEIRDRSVLRLHDPSSADTSGYAAPIQPTSPIRIPPQVVPVQQHASDDMNYFSEPEYDADTLGRRKRAGNGGYKNSIRYSAERQISSLGNRYRSNSVDQGPVVGSAIAPPKPQRFINEVDLGPPPPPVGNYGIPSAQPPPPLFLFRASSYNPPSTVHTASAQWSDPPVPQPSLQSQPPHDPPPPSHYQDYQERPRSSSRSGSITPIIDEEARFRMETMEQQLSNLSSLVHTALMNQVVSTKSLNNAVFNDIEALRRDIFNAREDQGSEAGSISRFSDVMYPSSQVSSSASDAGIVTVTSGLRRSIRQARRRVHDLQSEVCQLRRAAQINAQTSRTIIRDTFDRIKFILITNKQIQQFAANAQAMNADRQFSQQSWIDQEHARFRDTMTGLEKSTNQLESEVDELRQRVINGNRRLRVSEVERFTELLTQIGRTAAELKGQFPEVQQRSKEMMESEMEKVVREERFLKEEPHRIDNLLRRCKKITSMMVTMKKLAYVQDPAASLGTIQSKEPEKNTATATPLVNGWSSVDRSRSGNAINSYVRASTAEPVKAPLSSRSDSLEFGIYPKREVSLDRTTIPQRQLPNRGGTFALDNILDELSSIAKPTSLGIRSSSGTIGTTQSSFVPTKLDARPMSSMGLRSVHDPSSVAMPDSAGGLFRKDHGSGFEPISSATSPYHRQSQTSYKQSYEANVARSLSESPFASWSDAGTTRYASDSKTDNAHRIRSTASPTPGPGFAARMHEASTILNRSRSTTPNSVSSEPVSFTAQPRKPPPPPPRSSSRGGFPRNPLVGSPTPDSGPPPVPAKPPPQTRYTDSDIAQMKKQFVADYQSFMRSEKRASSQTPTPTVQTNAIDDEPKFFKSASSSESVNSQDGGVPPCRPPPPADPIRR